MSWILIVSIAVRLAALAWSAVLWRRLRDWRMGLVTAMLALMAARQSLTLVHLWTEEETQGAMLRELPGLVVSGLALVFVILLDRLVVTRRRSEERYRSLFEQSLDAIFVSTRSGELVDINPAGVRLFGYDSRDELLRVDIARDLYWDSWERESSLRRLEADGVLRDHELVLKRKDGTRLVVIESSIAVRDEDGEVLAVQGILRDVTERRRLEEELRRSQRMEAIGRLAGGIAHDFNNLLTVINGQTDLILAGLGPDDPLSREVGEIKAAGRRAAALTRQLLILSQRRAARPETIDLGATLGEHEPLLRQVVGRDVEVVLRLAADLPPVRIDRSLLEQALLNLAINARETMAGTGRLTIEAEPLRVGGEPGPAPVGLEPGAYVRLRVRDTGAGVDDQAREHLFEPFYSPAGGGESGLGLATVYGIVEQSGGAIRVDSEPGLGTVFEILLPEVGAERLASVSRARTGDGSGSETILLAEDELPVRNLLQEYLVTQGYRVLEAADGREAMEIADRASDRIDLVLADVVMPGMRGSELARQLAEHHPRIKVLLMSGYAETPPAGAAGDSWLAGSEFIQKPFSTEALGLKVRELLDRES